ILLHHAIGYLDVRYANGTRRVTPIEQMVHSFLEVLPIAAFLLVCALDFGQLAALFGDGTPKFGIHLRNPALPVGYLSAVIVAALSVGLAPYGEELVRCMRAAQR